MVSEADLKSIHDTVKPRSSYVASAGGVSVGVGVGLFCQYVESMANALPKNIFHVICG